MFNRVQPRSPSPLYSFCLFVFFATRENGCGVETGNETCLYSIKLTRQIQFSGVLLAKARTQMFLHPFL